ncbi:MAG TPA: PspC domain-containing protein [Candidatus Limnocylindrales bacterium]|nr:PspC domain-containing protein [Candidatus Limnocylindrales bacterium]
MQTRLERSTTNKVIGGVCGGIADYIQVDPTLVRVFFVIAGLLTAGLGFLGYLVLLVMMPLPGRAAPFVKDAAGAATPGAAGAYDAGNRDPGETTLLTPASAPVPPDPEAAERRRATFGYFLVALGVVFLLSNLGVFRIFRWDLVWPLVFVGAGVLLLAQRVRR